MPYTNNPATVPRDAMYVELGLTDPLQQLLQDEEADYYLARANGDVVQGSVQAARMILFKLAQNSRFRNDTLEVFADQYKQWQQALQMYIAANDAESTKKSIGIAVNKATGFAGGISVADYNANLMNADNNAVVPVVEFDTTLGSNPFSF